MTSQNDAQAVTIFPQGHPTASGGAGAGFSWAREDFDLANTGCTLAHAEVFSIPAIRYPALRTTWRGRPILSEEDLANRDCPYPPERDWEDA